MYGSAGTRNPPKQNPNLNKPEVKQVERNRNRRHACRDTSSRRKSELFGADDHIRGPGNHQGAAQDPMRFFRVRQTSTGTNIPILLATTPITLIRRCCHTNKNLRCWDMRCLKKKRKNAPHHTAQNASTHHPDTKKIQRHK